MKRASAVKLILAIVVVLFATFSTARARQLWSESQARTDYRHAQTRVDRLLQRAGAIGLVETELAPFRIAARRLASDPAPAPSPLWDFDRAHFYSAHASRFRRLGAHLREFMRAVRARARQTTGSELAAFSGLTTQGDALELDVRHARSKLARYEDTFRSASTPRGLRALDRSIAQGTMLLGAEVRVKAAYVASVVAAGHHDTASIIRLTDTEVQSEQQQLELYSLVSPRGAKLASALAGLVTEVHAQKTPFAAALKEFHVHEYIGALTADFRTGLPDKVIVVSTETQSATAYKKGRPIFHTLVTTGGPELPTDHGVFHIYLKLSPFTFHSPWPKGSPYYYPPTPITYWMPFDQAEGLHDASWRSNFGPGSNYAPTNLGTGNSILGTHGCVNLPFVAASFVWGWAPVGTTVVVV
jgi:hypothetical protein